ncbi:Polysaccharide biosynthesis protein WlaX [Thioalkalivibrio nitratireducens DSM 14787]|uniref:Polysaccharide biosynthesis protein WlaX n=1 Tax=Thioalkalivibrio nitratireducens (strain DSM 14787 / UNIQEM 213 / ALEN2) TaxID=1255043 RepID=L0DSD6_THIND|nr:3'-5' exonuclease [Thioalkalivibrio nitratireducens]AGA32524.1 Polysaccharide biosynthesis protein WlaX [Thioalkalivibrio nitratireducens DSM 14787]
MSGPVLVFDLETVPDIEGGRRLHDFDGLSDAEVAEALFALRRIKTGSEFLAHPLHRVVSIGVLYQGGDQMKLSAFGRDTEDEAEVLRQFFDVIEKRTPTLVSWNGGGFDLPVLHYRALLHGVQAPRYWDQGDDDRSFRYNNYLNRFHWRHVDLMDVLAAYQARACAGLDMIASLLGFPGKLGMDGSQVWPAWRDGDRECIHDYVEHDVLNTYLVYLRFERMRGGLSSEMHGRREAQLRDYLATAGRPNLDAFLAAWDGASPVS